MALRGSLIAKVAQSSKTKQGDYQGRFHQYPAAGPPLPSPATLGVDQKTPQSNLFVWRATSLTIREIVQISRGHGILEAVSSFSTPP